MADAAHRPWCAVCQFTGKYPFTAGTVWTDRGEHEERARELLETMLGERFPSVPEILKVVPGQIVFVPDD